MNFLDTNGLEQIYMLTMAKIDNKIISAATSTSPKASGLSASIGEEVKFARGDHVHPPGYSNKLTENLVLNLGTGRSEFNVGNPIYLTLNNIGAYDLANRGTAITATKDNRYDLNKLDTAGNYYVLNRNTAVNIDNSPFESSGYRLISQVGYGSNGEVSNHGYQIAFSLDGNIKFRCNANGTWGNWFGYLKISGGELTGNLTVPTLTIGDTENKLTHLKFNRNGVNYICFPSGGSISINAEDTASDSTVASLLIESKVVRPGKDNFINLGTSSKKWSTVYATTFDGALNGNAKTASELATNRTLTIGNSGKFFNGSTNVSWTLNEIGAYDLVNRGTKIPMDSDLNEYTTAGNYYVDDGDGAHINNTPFTSRGYRLICQNGYTRKGINKNGYQIAFGYNNLIKFRSCNYDTNTWADWTGYLPLSGGTLTGDLEVKNLTIAGTDDGLSCLRFNGYEGNYICFQSGGCLSINTNSGTLDKTNASLIITSGNVRPGKTDTIDLGSPGCEWRNVYATNLYGDLIGGTNVLGAITIKNSIVKNYPAIGFAPCIDTSTVKGSAYIYEDMGSTTGYTKNELAFRVYSPTSSGATTINQYYEDFKLPSCNIGRTKTDGDVTYQILTTKEVITVDQGGTGATTASDARTNLEVPSKTGDGASGTWGISISGNAASATNINMTLTNPSSNGTYAIPFHYGVSNGAKSLRTNDGLAYLTLEGTESAYGYGAIRTGNSTALGTAGNKQGRIYMYGKGTGYTLIVPGNDTSSNITLTLPSSGGVIALTKDFLPLSGGNLTGALNVNGDITVQKDSAEARLRAKYGDNKYLYLYGNTSSGKRGLYDSTYKLVAEVSDTDAYFRGNLQSNTFSGVAGYGNLIELPILSFTNLGVQSGKYSDYFKELLKWICKNYSGEMFTFIGTAYPGVRMIMSGTIYNTLEVNVETELPNYSAFTAVDPYGDTHYFGTRSYEYYYNKLDANYMGVYSLKDRGTEITATKDKPFNLDTITTPGNYYVGDKDIAKYIANSPFTGNGYRLITQTGYTDGVKGHGYQLAFGSNNLIKFRTNYNGTWKDWTKIMESHQAIPYIKGSSDDAAGVWTGTYSGITSLVDGLTIIYVPAVAGLSPETTLNINGLGAKTCYYTNTSKLTTHFAANTPILFTYVGGSWKRADYDSNTNTQIRIYRQTSGYNADYPIIVSRTATSGIGTSDTNSTYTGVYGVIGNNGVNTPTINPHSGLIKSAGYKLNSGTADMSAGTLKIKTINAPISSDSSNYGPGNSGQVLKSNGSTVYWGTVSGGTSYTLPQATDNALGGVKIGYSENGKNYPVKLNTSGQMYVNVPWTSTSINDYCTLNTDQTITGVKTFKASTTFKYSPTITEGTIPKIMLIPTSTNSGGTTSKAYIEGLSSDVIKLWIDSDKTDVSKNRRGLELHGCESKAKVSESLILRECNASKVWRDLLVYHQGNIVYYDSNNPPPEATPGMIWLRPI